VRAGDAGTAQGGGLPAAAWVVALAGLSGMGPARLGALLERWEPHQAWRQVEEGRAHLDARVVAGARRLGPELSARWRREVTTIDVAARWAAHIEAGVEVALRDDPAFPAPLRDDHEPPAVLFSCGSLHVLRRPRVAVVGTRRCTYAGRATARQLGRELGAAGVCVVSGLAHGIDAEAHLGALEARAGAPPAAVVGTGLDVVYPRRNAELWAEVAAAGCVLCEYPLATRPAAWRFPARNRIIAALADVVVVVESHARGGSMHTVDAALERDRPVMAVPGPVRSPASTGTNDLLVAGSAPVRDAADVLAVLDLDAGATTRGRADLRPVPSPSQSCVLDAVGWEPATIEMVALRVAKPLPAVALELSHLERDGWLVRCGAWFERIGSAS
jgi:DNA processing protein